MPTVKKCSVKEYNSWFLSLLYGNFFDYYNIQACSYDVFNFYVLFVKLCDSMLCLGLGVPEDVPMRSASMLTLLVSFINSVTNSAISSRIKKL